MIEQSLVTLLLVVATVIVSYKGFTNPRFMSAYNFDVNKVLARKEYVRLVSSGFLHNGWWHLVFNMLALFAFGGLLEPMIGGLRFLVIYLLGMVGGKLLALLVHKGHWDYTSVGASGAVNAVIYATIALVPDMGIGFFFLPLSIPAWAFGVAYVLFSIYGMKANWGNTNHAAHLGGALIGMLTAAAFYPEVAAANYLPVLLIVVPTVAFLLLVFFKPETLVIDSFGKKKPRYSIDHEYNYQRSLEQADVDSILEKIHRRGMKSLTRKEKETLEHYSKMRR